MKMLAIGWDRKIATRKLFDLNLADAQEEEGYGWRGLRVRKAKSPLDIHVWSDANVVESGTPSLTYKFRLHVGTNTMGGDYAADLLVSADDVLAMFKQAFGHLSVDDLLALMKDKQSPA